MNHNALQNPGFLFDMDGVLIDSREFHWSSWQKLQNTDQRVKLSYQEFLDTFGMTNEAIIQKFMPNLTAQERKEIAAKKENLFREECRGKLDLLPGIEAFLKQLESEKIPKVIASSAPAENLRFFLANTPLSLYFSDFVSGEEVAKGKPAPDVFLKAAEHLKLPPVQCIVIEDAPVGLAAGKAAGSFLIALETTKPASQLNPHDLIFPSPKELNLKEIIGQWKEWHHIKHS